MPQERPNGHRIKQLHILARQRMGGTLEQLELTPAQSHVLHYLVEHRAQCPGPRDVEEFFSLTHPTVSGILSRLEAKGFVSFRTDRDDRRCKRIHVSEKALTTSKLWRSKWYRISPQRSRHSFPVSWTGPYKT